MFEGLVRWAAHHGMATARPLMMRVIQQRAGKSSFEKGGYAYWQGERMVDNKHSTLQDFGSETVVLFLSIFYSFQFLHRNPVMCSESSDHVEPGLLTLIGTR